MTPTRAAWERRIVGSDSATTNRAKREQARHAVDALLETHGVECIEDENERVQAFYCNAGDTYAATMIFRGREAYIGCWGDVVEVLGRRGIAVR